MITNFLMVASLSRVINAVVYDNQIGNAVVF